MPCEGHASIKMSRSKLDDFETLSRLGAGSFGTVYKVKRVVDDQIYVIKNVRIAELGFKEQSEAINEVQILAQLKSPYVVKYFDSFIESESLHIGKPFL
jgi:NIMA (never in mitosis gene a)-related kinase